MPHKTKQAKAEYMRQYRKRIKEASSLDGAELEVDKECGMEYTEHLTTGIGVASRQPIPKDFITRGQLLNDALAARQLQRTFSRRQFKIIFKK